MEGKVDYGKVLSECVLDSSHSVRMIEKDNKFLLDIRRYYKSFATKKGVRLGADAIEALLKFAEIYLKKIEDQNK